MSNMAYCRFQNTAADMDDCIENIDCKGEMSEDELTARTEFIEKCVDIALDYGHEIDKYLVEE